VSGGQQRWWALTEQIEYIVSRSPEYRVLNEVSGGHYGMHGQGKVWPERIIVAEIEGRATDGGGDVRADSFRGGRGDML
jgi:hypothetical protein